MIKTFIYIGIFVSTLLISCGKEPINVDNNVKLDSITEVQYSSDPDYVLSNKNAQELIEHLEKEQNELKRKLQNVTKKDAEALYLDYYKRMTVIVDSINTAESKTLSAYYNIKHQKNDSILRKEKAYKKVGLYLRKVDSTTYDFRIKPGYFYNLFNKKVSKEYAEYLKLRYLEHDMAYKLQFNNEKITLEDQRNLIISWEKFILNNKDFKFIDYAKKSYTDNIMAYLLGTTAKPAFEVSTKKLYVENEQEYISFVKKNPKLISAEITKSFLKHFYANDRNFTAEVFYLDLKEFTKNEIAQQLK